MECSQNGVRVAQSKIEKSNSWTVSNSFLIKKINSDYRIEEDKIKIRKTELIKDDRKISQRKEKNEISFFVEVTLKADK